MRLFRSVCDYRSNSDLFPSRRARYSNDRTAESIRRHDRTDRNRRRRLHRLLLARSVDSFRWRNDHFDRRFGPNGRFLRSRRRFLRCRFSLLLPRKRRNIYYDSIVGDERRNGRSNEDWSARDECGRVWIDEDFSSGRGDRRADSDCVEWEQ